MSNLLFKCSISRGGSSQAFRALAGSAAKLSQSATPKTAVAATRAANVFDAEIHPASWVPGNANVKTPSTNLPERPESCGLPAVGDHAQDVLHDVLINEKVHQVFGIPGRSIKSDPFRSIYHSNTMKTIIARQEQNAGHMAEGYSRATGKPGVVVVSSPYAVPSLVTPMQDALADGTPLVVLSTFCPSECSRPDEFQEPDVLGIALACTKWSSRVTSVAELGQKVREAFQIATSGRPGPVLLEVPSAILSQSMPYLTWPTDAKSRTKPLPIGFFGRTNDAKSGERILDKVAQLIDMAEKPVLYVGQGILARPEGPAILKEFAEKTNIPVTTTLQGLGAFDERDPKSLHMLGLHGAAYANMAVQNADLILAIGARFDDRVTGSIPKFAPGALAASKLGRGGIVHFDIAPKNVDKVVQVDEVVLGDCAINLAKLIPRVAQVEERSEWFSQIDGWKKSWPLSAYSTYKTSQNIKPQAAIEKLSDMLETVKDRVVISTGVGQHQMWAAQHFRWRFPRTMLTSGGLGTMGYGLPAAIAAKVARPECQVIDIDGDASFSMSIAELATAAHYGIPVKVLLLNNEEMGMVSDLQRFYFDKRFTQNKHANPDFVLASQAFGVAADRVVDPADLEQKLKWLIESEGPAVLEVVTERDMPVWPIVPAGKGLHEFITYPKVE